MTKVLFCDVTVSLKGFKVVVPGSELNPDGSIPKLLNDVIKDIDTICVSTANTLSERFNITITKEVA